MSNINFLSIDQLNLQEFDSNSELIPLLTPEDEEEMNNEELPASLPILPYKVIYCMHYLPSCLHLKIHGSRAL